MNAIALFAVRSYWDLPMYWHLPILLVVISLVYSATRFDPWSYILREAVRWALRMAAFLLAIEIVLYVLDRCI
jgi:hypothetical protein